jgi:hypothetical protein
LLKHLNFLKKVTLFHSYVIKYYFCKKESNKIYNAMKKITLIFALVALSFTLSANTVLSSLNNHANDTSLIIYDSDMNILNDQSTTVLSLDYNAIHTYSFKVKNNTGNDLYNVHMKKNELSLVEGAALAMCDRFNCYPSFVDITQRDTLLGGGTLSDFKLDYMPMGNTGTSSVEIVFYDSISCNTPFTAKTTVSFKITAMSADQDVKTSINGPYPNPATGRIGFTHKFSSSDNNVKVIIRNMLGQQVLVSDIDTSAERTNLNIENLSSGIYLCTFVIDGKIFSSKKLIVK